MAAKWTCAHQNAGCSASASWPVCSSRETEPTQPPSPPVRARHSQQGLQLCVSSSPARAFRGQAGFFFENGAAAEAPAGGAVVRGPIRVGRSPILQSVKPEPSPHLPPPTHATRPDASPQPPRVPVPIANTPLLFSAAEKAPVPHLPRPPSYPTSVRGHTPRRL
ncbi:hypothetical protein METBIDRAFT_11618 [Metschnikowia bicuspidata var. bicuspidata NRRL YB-4993]|uniref:Uncharacterized protein n=1 Tax=Metschnikowia bicuspidata var. bicuspidata NRRL YB-4993 TaxID=869754 RepID=A0A1A0HAJ4_9ASCO|nr:hypothetical protein METBIDRAFT_11618 [Metschnikowia bicuspidata var. bicuspidata NRRL YB-4993]OBA21031.1 hypothetical protein METBIDRAFT_11618 [Metschnikowia bicuspidata var. bicuspidata NRRL YB-4993]